ncbi:MAG TPA: glycosyltransferase family 4 protein [Pyrinomonadaceae bacterium]|nr:glycosyltransferase family 4 protein [Pyrinomonadaceae bacterium]
MRDFPIVQVSREIGLRGGSECVAYELHRAWRALRINAQVITSFATESEAREGINLIAPWLSDWSEWGYLTTALALPIFTLLATMRVRRDFRAGVVLSHGDSLAGDVCIVHAVNRASLAEKRRAGYYQWLFNPANLWVAWRDWFMLSRGRYRRVVAISERVRQQLKEYYGVPDEKIVTIPNGINLSRFSPDHVKARNEMRRSLGFDESTPLVLFVGSQFRLKGLEVAIRALARMKTQAHLLVVGNDAANGFRQLAKELGIAERVHFLGARKDLPEIYPAADAFVFPSLYETFALVCLEAMASGLPVLASRVGGIEDYLRDEENGLFIKREGQDIAQKLDRVLADAELRARLRSNGFKTAANYSWDKIAQQYLRLFDQLMMEREAATNGGIINQSALSTST